MKDQTKKKSPVDLVAPLERASEAVKPLKLTASKGINPGGYAVDLVAANGSKRELASGMGPHEMIAFLDGIVAAMTFVKAGK